MSQYTDAASRPGKQGAAGTDDRKLFLTEFGGYIINSYDEAIKDYNALRWIKNITQGKSDTFPIIGRKRDAADHTPGELILGGQIEHNEVEITLDQMVYDSAFIAEIDELMVHYELSQPYAHQIGMSLGSLQCRRIAIMHILASRKYFVGAAATGVPQGQPAPTYYSDAALRTNASKIEDWAFFSKQYLLENDISGEKPAMRIPWAQYLLAARNFGMATLRPESGSGNIVSGTVGASAGLDIVGTNFIPKTNITTGPTKYQGNFTNTVGHVSSKMAVGTLERRGLRVVQKDQEDRLGTLLIGSQFNGHGVLRPECSIEGAVAARA